jgi:hypothetical protein
MSVKSGDETIEVLKTYDQHVAKEAFRNMDDSALAHLASSLKLESIYEPSGIPKPTDEGYKDFIWDVMVDEAPGRLEFVLLFHRHKVTGAPNRRALCLGRLADCASICQETWHL